MALLHWGIRSIHTSHCSVDSMCCSWDMCLSCQDTGDWEDYLEWPQGGGSVKQQPNNQQQEQQGHIVWSVHYTCSREDNTFHDQGSRQPMEAGKWWAKSQNAMVGIELRNTIAEGQACLKIEDNSAPILWKATLVMCPNLYILFISHHLNDCTKCLYHS